MKLWEDEQTINKISKMSNDKRIDLVSQLTQLTYNLMENGLRQRLKIKERKKILEIMKNIIKS